MPRQPAMRRVACLTRSGRDQRAVGRKHAMQTVDDRVKCDDVLEHFHADNAVVRSAMRVAVEFVDMFERHARQMTEARATVVDLRIVDLGADCRRRRVIAGAQQSEKRAVATAVVEQPATAEDGPEPQAGFEPLPVAPRNQPILAVDLLGRVVAVPDGDIGV